VLPLLCLTPTTEGFPWDDLRKFFNERSGMVKVPNGVETLRKISIAWVGRTNVTDDTQTADDDISSRSLKVENVTRYIFNALHGMQTRSSDENSVRLSVCPSVRCDLWQNERKLCRHSYTTWKTIYSSFVTRRMVGGGDPFYLKFWVNRPPLERNRRLWTDIRSYRLSGSN